MSIENNTEINKILCQVQVKLCLYCGGKWRQILFVYITYIQILPNLKHIFHAIGKYLL